jgi:hypothetical protein
LSLFVSHHQTMLIAAHAHCGWLSLLSGEAVVEGSDCSDLHARAQAC